ncbi:PTS glucose transporter subunit IIA [Jeotgalibaca sp. MA1X17-3]|uniref:PTS sugar transporter subunit IIA n=1 Tax=Jeotgalibaca sp. MA1X17-3 TaxID=2908211 RepID=UPI001F317A0B|nr:PTS glucose transporter subunit IIA [Jeotgalibaca sp. MA1X17-3]UJF16532.1 PTS glucose transporter subunit IIA [Jeotgalibaca sp. MA1X17-3]
MFNFFKKDKKEQNGLLEKKNLYSPVNGKIIPVSEVADPVFSQKMMGDGYAVIPTDGNIYSPADGEILSVFPTKHAIGIQLEDGLELLVHMGLDTVELNGKPFETHVKEGDKVTAETLIATCDLDALAEAGKNNAMVVVITNMDKVKELTMNMEGQVQAHDVVGSVQPK